MSTNQEWNGIVIPKEFQLEPTRHTLLRVHFAEPYRRLIWFRLQAQFRHVRGHVEASVNSFGTDQPSLQQLVDFTPLMQQLGFGNPQGPKGLVEPLIFRLNMPIEFVRPLVQATLGYLTQFARHIDRVITEPPTEELPERLDPIIAVADSSQPGFMAAPKPATSPAAVAEITADDKEPSTFPDGHRSLSRTGRLVPVRRSVHKKTSRVVHLKKNRAAVEHEPTQ